MPRTVISDAKGLVQSAGAGTTISNDAVFSGAASIAGALSLASTFGLTDVGAKTAGATQTEAGATAITNVVTVATVGTGNDGLKLPAGVVGDVRIISNLSAAAAKVYTTGTDKINGTDPDSSGNSSVVIASKTTIFLFTGSTRGWATVISA
jgi:hypothetical protein